MSGLFGDDEDNAAVKLLRAGRATGPTIFTAPANDASETTGQAYRPRGGELKTVSRPPPDADRRRTIVSRPNDVVAKRFPEEGEIKGVVVEGSKIGELADAIRRIKERARTEQERAAAEKLRRDWERRLLFNSRPLSE